MMPLTGFGEYIPAPDASAVGVKIGCPTFGFQADAPDSRIDIAPAHW